ncbi:hypothetical protein [Legionella saoudiensis]|uniref:hypothetical protein n=1 Tax=Legionella saoudiensis TaxID=1750561 RepID=UPI0007318D80|nr:hypothetical protein [Legionella saoudiensis]
MKVIHIAQPQTVNACTLISVAVINAILRAKDDLSMIQAVAKAHNDSQAQFIEFLKNNTNEDVGAGMLEVEAYNQYYADSFQAPIQDELFAPASNIDIDEFIRIRSTYEDFYEFLAFNLEKIEALQREDREGNLQEVNWERVTAEELKRRIPASNTPSIEEQFRQKLNQLNSAGMTIRTEGHTISVVQHKETYYSYDSLTGDLVSTDDAVEMANFIAKKLANNQAQSAILYTFSPGVVLDVVPDIAPVDDMVSKREQKARAIHNKLTILDNKAKNLYARNYEGAALAAEFLIEDLKGLVTRYLQNNLTEEELNARADEIFEEHRRGLEEFRGWKLKKGGEILANLALLIGTLGGSYLITGRFTVFSVKTDSAAIVSDVENEIKNKLV